MYTRTHSIIGKRILINSSDATDVHSIIANCLSRNGTYLVTIYTSGIADDVAFVLFPARQYIKASAWRVYCIWRSCCSVNIYIRG